MKTKMKARTSISLLVSVVALAISGAAAGTAAASNPLWHFNGSELTSTETIVGGALSSSMTIPGATTECKHFLYSMKVKNTSGDGTGEITELPLFECSTNTSTCTVNSIEAEKLPWPAHLTTVSGKDYVYIENIYVGIVYGGELCALSGSLVRVKGTAGGVTNNEAQTATFNSSTFKETGAQLKVGATPVEWQGEFTVEPFEKHREEKIEVY